MVKLCKQCLLNQHSLTDTGVSYEEDVSEFAENRLSNVSVTSPIDSLDIDVVEFSSLEDLSLQELIPRSPVALLQVDIVVEDCVGGGEHRLNVTNDDVELTSACLIDSGTKRPDHREDEPLLNVSVEVFLWHLLFFVRPLFFK